MLKEFSQWHFRQQQNKSYLYEYATKFKRLNFNKLDSCAVKGGMQYNN